MFASGRKLILGTSLFLPFIGGVWISCGGPNTDELTPLQKQEAAQLDEAEKRAYTLALAGPTGVTAAIGRFVLLRRESGFCAIRFTEFRRGHDAKRPSLFSSGDESVYAEYDWYYQGDGSGDFSKPNVEQGHGEASRKEVVSLGFGRFSMRKGIDIVKCGPLRPGWYYPSGISLLEARWDGYELRSNGIEAALTKWKEISEVRVYDPRLNWYRFDEEQNQKDPFSRDVFIPVEDLPGGRSP